MLEMILVSLFGAMAYMPAWHYSRAQVVAIAQVDCSHDTECSNGLCRCEIIERQKIKGEIKGKRIFVPPALKDQVKSEASVLIFGAVVDSEVQVNYMLKQFDCYYVAGDSLMSDSRCLNIQDAKKYCVNEPNRKGCEIACMILKRENGDSTCFVKYAK